MGSMTKAAWQPFMTIDDSDEIDDVLLDAEVRTIYGDRAPVTEISLFGKSMLTTEVQSDIDDAASALATDFLHDFTFSTRH